MEPTLKVKAAMFFRRHMSKIGLTTEAKNRIVDALAAELKATAPHNSEMKTALEKIVAMDAVTEEEKAHYWSDRAERMRDVAMIALGDDPANKRKEATATIDDWQAKYEHVLGLLRNTKMQHGTCQPRSRKACTACNSQEELDKILKDWKGFTMVLS